MKTKNLPHFKTQTNTTNFLTFKNLFGESILVNNFCSPQFGIIAEKKAKRSLLTLSMLLILMLAVSLSGISAPVQPNTWIGSEGAAWNVYTNWELGRVPLSTDEVVIPVNGSVSITTSAECYNLTINSGATVTNNSTLTIGNAMSGEGTFTNNSASAVLNIGGDIASTLTLSANVDGNSVNYNGTETQSVKGTTYANLTISGSGIKTLDGDTEWNGNLTVKAGTELATGTYSLTVNSSTIQLPYVILDCGASSAGSVISGFGTLNLSTLKTDLIVNDLNTGDNGATISCDVVLGSGSTIKISGDNTSTTDLTISGVISGTDLCLTAGVEGGRGTLELSGANTYTGQTIINEGTTLKLGAAGSESYSPLGTVENQGTSVNIGGVLDLNGFTLATNEALRLTGTGNSDGGALINSSTNPVSYNGNIYLMNNSTIGTTGDITITSFINEFSHEYFPSSLTKVGVGTLIISSNGSNNFKSLIISEGTVELGWEDIIPDQPLALGEGTFSTGATTGFNETVGTLALTDNSSIHLGTGGHALHFSASDAVSWTADKILTITGWEGTSGSSGTAGKIYFGASTGTLTTAQLSQITFERYGGTATLLSTGELVPQTDFPVLAISGNTDHGSTCVSGSVALVSYTITNTGTVAAEGVSVESDNIEFAVSNVSSTTIAANGGTATYDVTFTPSNAGECNATITVTSTTSGANSPTSSLTGEGIASGTWIGITSSDWNTASNWCGGIPTALTDVTVSSGTPYQPVISNPSNGYCRSLTINSGATVTNNYHLYIEDDLSGEGELLNIYTDAAADLHIGGDVTIATLTSTGDNSTVFYDGSAQTVKGTTYKYLTISGSGTKTLGGNVNFNSGGNLKVDDGTTLDLGTYSLGAAGRPSGLTLICGVSAGSVISGLGILYLGGTLEVKSNGNNGATISCPLDLGDFRFFNIYDDGTNATELTISGVISGDGFGITKGGAGSLTLSSSTGNSFTGGLTIMAGTVQLGSYNIVLHNTLTLMGGTLSTGAAAGYNATAGNLALFSNSNIHLGTGPHSLDFDASKDETWIGTLTIKGWTGTPGSSGTSGKIYFGASAGTLTAVQLSQITFEGYSETPVLLSNGELVPGAQPLITVGTISDFGNQCINIPSAEKSYSVSGSGLTADIVITPPTGFEISKTSGSGFSNSAITLTQTSGSVASTSIYVRYFPTSTGITSGSITHTSATSGVNSPTILVTGTGLANPTATAPAVGDGTIGTPYEIATLENLYWIAVNPSSWGGYFIQTADIDASQTTDWCNGGWLPIGNSARYFSGHYDGQNHTISGLYMVSSSTQAYGLFGNTEFATFQNLGITDVYIEVEKTFGAGALTGDIYRDVTIDNCYSTGVVKGYSHTGGLVGYIDGNSVIRNSYSTCDVSSVSSNAGGLVGCSGAYTQVVNCFHSEGIVKCIQGSGGLIGDAGQTIISKCYSTGEVIGNINTGGLAGINEWSAIDDSYSRCSVKNTSTFQSCGGLVGFIRGDASIRNCYSTGPVQTGMGGLVGSQAPEDEYGNPVIMNSFWDTETSGAESSAGGEGKSTAEMTTLTTFTNALWDFNTIWGWEAGCNDGYPNLVPEILRLPSVTIISDASGEVCAFVDVTFTAILENTGGGEVSYEWNHNGNKISGNQTFTFGDLEPGDVISCEITVTNNASYSSAKATSNEISVADYPDAGVISVAEGDNVIQVGETITLNSTEPDGFWSCKEDIVTVDFITGVVTGNKVGTTTIYYIIPIQADPPCYYEMAVSEFPITVTDGQCADGTIALASESGSDNQTVCAGTAITPIVYTVGGEATGAYVSPALPDDLSGVYDANLKTYTISGTPTIYGILSFDVITTGSSPCSEGTATVSINAFGYSGGDGTEGNPFQIATLADLQFLSENNCHYDKHFIQTADIDATDTKNWNSGAGWLPIGTSSSPFVGTYDGQGYTINNLYINRPGSNNQGLFGYSGKSAGYAKIQNLGLTNVEITGYNSTGGLVGCNYWGYISNCYTTGKVTGIDENTGGIAGMCWLGSSLTYCYSSAQVTGKWAIGGLVGTLQNYATITNCYSRGSVTSTSGSTSSAAGGLAGYFINTAVIRNCYSTGLVSGPGAGGLIGNKDGSPSVYSSYWDITTSGQTTSAGGTPLSTLNMKNQWYYPGWDFTLIWGIHAATNDGYPYLVTESACVNGTIAQGMGSNNQTVFANVKTTVGFFIGGGATGAMITPALPEGFTGNFDPATGIYTISGISTSALVYNYTVTTTGTISPCTGASATGTLTVIPQPECAGYAVGLIESYDHPDSHPETYPQYPELAVGLPDYNKAFLNYGGEYIVLDITGSNYLYRPAGSSVILHHSVNISPLYPCYPNITVESSMDGTTWGGQASYDLENGSNQNKGINLQENTRYLKITLNNCIMADGVMIDAVTYDPVNVPCKCVSLPASLLADNNGPVCEGQPLNLTASMAEGATYTWTGPNGFASIEQNPTVSNAATTDMAGTYSVTVTVGECTSEPATTTVVVNPLPTLSSISVYNAESCYETDVTVTIDGLVAGPNTINFDLSADGGDPINYDVDVTASEEGVYSFVPFVLPVGNYTLTVKSIKLGALAEGEEDTRCIIDQFIENEATWTVYAVPTANAGSGGDVCGLGFVLDATASVGTGTWTQESGPGTADFKENANDPDATISVDVYGTYVFRWTEENGPCSDFDEVTVNFYQQPVADAGDDQSQCDNSNFTISAGSLTKAAIIGPSGIWEFVGDYGVAKIENNYSETTTVTDVPFDQDITLRWTVTNGVCSDFDDVVLRNNSLPEASPETLEACDNGNETADFTLTDADATVIGVQTGVTVTYHATLTDADNNENALASPYNSGSKIVYARLENDATGCYATSEVTLTVNPQPTLTSFTVDNAKLCVAGGYATVRITFGGLLYTDNTINVTYLIRGSLVGTITTDIEITQSMLTENLGSCYYESLLDCYPASYQLIVNSITANGCTTTFNESEKPTVSWNIYLEPTVSISELSYCGKTILTVNTDVVSASFSWYKYIGSELTPIPGATGSTLEVTESGTYSVEITNTETGCSNGTWSDVTVYPVPTASISGDLEACGGTILTAETDDESPSYIWRRHTETGYYFIPEATGSSLEVTESGTYSVMVINTETGCSKEAKVIVTINPLPEVDAGTYSAVCEDAVNVPLVGSPTGGVWKGTGVSEDQTTGYVFDPTGNVGDNTLTYTYTDDNGCSNSDDASIHVDAFYLADAGEDQSQCNNSTFTISAGSLTKAAIIGPSGIWDFVGEHGTAQITNANSATTTVTNVPFDQDITLQWTVTNGTCIDFDDVVLRNNSLPTVEAGTFDDVCVDAIDVALPTGGVWVGEGVGGNQTDGYFFDPTGHVGDNTLTFTVTDSETGCTNSEEAIIHVNDLPTVDAGTYAAVCENADDVVLVGSPAGGIWEGTGVSGNQTEGYFFDPTGHVGYNTLTYTFTDSETGCTNSEEAIIHVNDLPAVDAGTYAAVCEDADDVVLVGSPEGGIWDGTGVSGNQTDGYFFDPTGHVGYNTLTYTITDSETGCTNSEEAIIHVNDLPAVDAGNYSAVCEDADDVVLVGSPEGGIWEGTGVSGDLESGYVFVASGHVGYNTLTYTYSGDNGCSNSDQTTIHVNFLPDCLFYEPGSVDGDPVLPNSTHFYTTHGTGSYKWTIEGNGRIKGYDDKVLIEVIAGENCDEPYTLSLTVTNNVTQCSSTCSKEVNVNDTEGPYLVDPFKTSASLDSKDNNWCLEVADAFDGSTLQNNVRALYADNGGAVGVICTSKTAGADNSNCNWTFTYHYQVQDGCSNSTTCDVTYSGGDTEVPVAICQNITIQLDNDGFAAIDNDAVNNGSSDNCSSLLSFDTDITSFNCSNVGANSVVLRVTDGCEKFSTCNAIVTVEDNIAPEITCPSGSPFTRSTDLNCTYYTVEGTGFDATATDACGIVSLVYACPTASVSSGTSLAGIQLPVGDHTIIWTAEDVNGNKSTGQIDVTVQKRSLVLTYTGDDNEQYSDQASLSALLKDEANAPVSGKTIRFTIGTQSVTGITGGDGIATATLKLEQSPVPAYTVMTEFEGDDTSMPATDEDPFNITQEIALIDYIGTNIVGEANPDVNTTPVKLVATITDIADAYRGDVRNARVRFMNGSTPIPDCDWLTPTLVNPADLTQGIVSVVWDAPVPTVGYTTYEIGIQTGTQSPAEADGFYKGYELTTLNVYRTSLNEFITGGGHIVPVDSKGEYASDPGRKTNFGFNVKWNKTMKNLQGNFNLILRRGSEIYQIKSNALSGLGIDGSNPCSHQAVLTAKANLNRVTGGITETLMGNLSLQVALTDNGEPGVVDRIGVTLYNGSTLLYSSNWPVSSTEELTLVGGNILVHDGLICNDSDITHTVIASDKNPSLTGEDVTFTATVYAQDATPQGTLVFTINGETFAGTLDSRGSASVDYHFDEAGTYEVEASYNSTNGYKPSTGTITQLVNGTSFILTSSKNPSVLGDEVIFTAVLNSPGAAPAGTVTFKVDGEEKATDVPLADKKATFTTNLLSSGLHTIEAVYTSTNDPLIVAEPATITQVVNNVTIALTSSKNPSAVSEDVTFTASVSGSTSAGKTVTFTSGTDVLGSAMVDASGNAGITSNFSTSGTFAVTAALSDPELTATINQIVTEGSNITVLLTSSVTSGSTITYGTNVSFTATINGSVTTPTGTVTFKDGTKVLKVVTVSGGKASYSTNKLAVGLHSITATYDLTKTVSDAISLEVKAKTKSVEIATGLVPEIELAELKVYPNPFSERLRFEFVSPETVDARIELYDMTGRLVKTIFEQPIEGDTWYDAEFRPDAIISAIYFYRVTLGEAIYNGKVIFKKE